MTSFPKRPLMLVAVLSMFVSVMDVVSVLGLCQSDGIGSHHSRNERDRQIDAIMRVKLNLRQDVDQRDAQEHSR